MQDNVVEMKVTYDDYGQYNDTDPLTPICGIGNDFRANKTCFLEFTAPKFMEPPILIHYELTNFHQNHRNYYQSRDEFQLNGRVGDQDSISRDRCQPLNKLGNITLNPCGMIANTMFNDVITLETGRDIDNEQLVMLEDGIAWASDLKYTFNQPEGFKYEECPECDDSCCDGSEWSCKEPYRDPKNASLCFKFFYPDDESTQYLWETYPEVVSPLEGVTNEHFVVWMRVATQPTFRKLYGWIDQAIPEGETLTFRVNANYVVTRFRGSKSLIVGTSNIFGGRNPYMGPIFYWVGFFCLLAGTFFALKHLFRPRRLADRKYLHYKED